MGQGIISKNSNKVAPIEGKLIGDLSINKDNNDTNRRYSSVGSNKSTIASSSRYNSIDSA